MRKRSDVRTLMRRELDKDAPAILNKLDKMLKQRVPRARIEKMLAAALRAHLKKQIKSLFAGVEDEVALV